MDSRTSLLNVVTRHLTEFAFRSKHYLRSNKTRRQAATLCEGLR
jgi:hypothetical protein